MIVMWFILRIRHKNTKLNLEKWKIISKNRTIFRGRFVNDDELHLANKNFHFTLILLCEIIQLLSIHPFYFISSCAASSSSYLSCYFLAFLPYKKMENIKWYLSHKLNELTLFKWFLLKLKQYGSNSIEHRVHFARVVTSYIHNKSLILEAWWVKNVLTK